MDKTENLRSQVGSNSMFYEYETPEDLREAVIARD